MQIPADRIGADGRVAVYATETGAPIRCWPVDAKELLASGQASLDPQPAAVEPSEPAPTPKPEAAARRGRP